VTTEVIGLLAETFIHPGIGQAAGAIDLPVARERTTSYPFIPGSSMKGALRDTVVADCKRLFGQQENAGQLLISDARLLLLPVRSLTSPYVWLTCPYLIERFRRDLERAGKGEVAAVAAPSGDEKVLAAATGELFLEELRFEREGPLPGGLAPAIGGLIADGEVRARLEKQIAVVTDTAFDWFAKYALPVQARNALDRQKKTSMSLWYEEALPPDTLMYILVGEREAGAAATLAAHLAECRYLQTGGNETVGQGWFSVRRLDGAAR
jgi:CRISPR-associated protein Cmr4